MKLLAIDIGSSSVKVAMMSGQKLVGRVTRADYPTDYRAGRAEIDPAAILSAVAKAIRLHGPAVKKVDLIAPTVMAPSWLAIDRHGKPLTPVITHQDRRSIEVAHEIELRVGKARHLKLSGNRPFPGGISSTTAAWFARHQPGVLKRATLLGHLGTYLLQQWTGQRVTDPSNASFMGLYLTPTLGGWSEELCKAIGIRIDQLPRVQDANVVAGTLQPLAALRVGLLAGTPVLTGCMDTSAAMLAIGTTNGQVLNVCGSTDVLAVCTDKSYPHEQLLTRGLGVGRKWMSVNTLAAAGSALTWAHQTLFPDLSATQFFGRIKRLRSPAESLPVFDPHLAGDRMSINQPRGAFTGLTLSTTRDDLLAAVVNSLARASAARLPLLQQVTKLRRDVVVSGGVADGLSGVLHRDWGKGWKFRVVDELTTKGLATLAAMAADTAKDANPD